MSMTLKRTLVGAAVAAFTLGATAVITTAPASARWGGGGWHGGGWHGGGWGWGGAGFGAGLAVGALTSPYYYGYGYPGYAYGYGYPAYAYNGYYGAPYNACSYNPWNCF